MPLKTALRKTLFRPKASSRPGGQMAKINQSRNVIARIAISAHAGWRSMNRVTCAVPLSGRRFAPAPTTTQVHQSQLLASPSACILPLVVAAVLGPRSRHPSGGARDGFDRQYLLWAPRRSSGAQDLGCAAIIRGRHSDIGRKKAGEGALRGKAEIETDIGDMRLGGDQRVERILHDQRVEIEMGRDAGLGAEQAVEMGARQPGL